MKNRFTVTENVTKNKPVVMISFTVYLFNYVAYKCKLHACHVGTIKYIEEKREKKLTFS